MLAGSKRQCSSVSMERQRRLFIIVSKVCFPRFQPLEFSPCIGEGYSATAEVRDDQYDNHEERPRGEGEKHTLRAHDCASRSKTDRVADDVFEKAIVDDVVVGQELSEMMEQPAARRRASSAVVTNSRSASPRCRSGSRRLLQFLDGAPHGLMLSLGTVEHSQHLSEFRIGQ